MYRRNKANLYLIIVSNQDYMFHQVIYIHWKSFRKTTHTYFYFLFLFLNNVFVVTDKLTKDTCAYVDTATPWVIDLAHKHYIVIKFFL